MSKSANDATSDWVYEELRRLIIQGRYGPGVRLVESRLAEELGVSRTPVREALARVAAEGLVHLYPNRGAVVRTFTHQEMIQIFDLRAVLEGYSAYQAALHIRPEELDLLEDQVSALEASLVKDFETHEARVEFFVSNNNDFHNTIIVASRNERLSDVLGMVVSVPLQFHSFYWYTKEELRISNFFHRSILHALRAGEADRARAVMYEHIYFGRDFLVNSLKEETLSP